MTGAAKRFEAGFTLVEMLVVLSLIGLMSGLMLALMGQFRNLAAADQRLTQQAALKKTANHIAGLFEQAAALPLEIGPDAPLSYLELTEGSARFLAVAKGGALTSGLFEIEISLKEHNGTKRLVQTISPRRALKKEAGNISFDLLDPADQLTFAFLQKAEAPGSALVWRPDWQFAGQLPAAVRVTLQAKDRSGGFTAASAIAFLPK